jgi:putative AlgH/UPF0301 family transcriptional regulator
MKRKAASDAAARDVGGIAIRLVDDGYAVWRRAQVECHIALRAWLRTRAGNHVAYHAYLAALDREEAAAIDLERVFELVAA